MGPPPIPPGLLDFIQSDCQSPQQSHCAAIALQQSQQALSVLNRVLDLAKVTSGKLQPESVEFEAQKWLVETVAPHENAATEKGLQCEWQQCSGCYWVCLAAPF